jgi:hypothetical protein
MRKNRVGWNIPLDEILGQAELTTSAEFQKAHRVNVDLVTR